VCQAPSALSNDSNLGTDVGELWCGPLSDHRVTVGLLFQYSCCVRVSEGDLYALRAASVALAGPRLPVPDALSVFAAVACGAEKKRKKEYSVICTESVICTLLIDRLSLQAGTGASKNVGAVTTAGIAPR
jgi:hypothetical protein